MGIEVEREDKSFKRKNGTIKVIAVLTTPEHKFRVRNEVRGGWTLMKRVSDGWLVKSRTFPSGIGYTSRDEKAINTFIDELRNGKHSDEEKCCA